MAQPMGQPMRCAMGGTQGIGPSMARPMVLGDSRWDKKLARLEYHGIGS